MLGSSLIGKRKVWLTICWAKNLLDNMMLKCDHWRLQTTRREKPGWRERWDTRQGTARASRFLPGRTAELDCAEKYRTVHYWRTVELDCTVKYRTV